MKTYLILMIGVLAPAYAAEVREFNGSVTNNEQVVCNHDSVVSAGMSDCSFVEQRSLARKAGGQKYRLHHKMKKLREKREREAKSQTA